MRRGEVHQFLPTLGYRDAIATHTLATRRALSAGGYRGVVWAERWHPEQRRECRLYTDYLKQRSARSGQNVLLYQASTGTDGMADFLVDRPEPLLICYHNITPAEFFEPYDFVAGTLLAHGRRELSALCKRARGALADSEFCARELRELADLEVRVVPPYLAPRAETPAAQSHVSWLRRTKRGIDMLFVGRVAPNKNHAALMRIFAAYREAIDPNARLFIVGAWGSRPYMSALMALRERLGPRGIVFTGSISGPHLAAHYQEADVFVCLSLHEGFGVPLVEAMRARVPLVAYDAGAVAETLGGAGVLVRSLDTPVVAELIHRVATDDELRKRIVEGQDRRVTELEQIRRDDVILDAVRAVRPE